MEKGDVLQVGAKAGLSILESSLLGAFAILCLTVAVVCVWLLNKTQNQRVNDQKDMTERMSQLIQKQSDFNTKTTSAIERLNESEKAQVQLLGQIQTMIQSTQIALMNMNSKG